MSIFKAILSQVEILRDALKKKVNFGTLAQKGGGGQNPKCWSVLNLGHLGKGEGV